MRPSRLLASAAIGALVAIPGFAMANPGSMFAAEETTEDVAAEVETDPEDVKLDSEEASEEKSEEDTSEGESEEETTEELAATLDEGDETDDEEDEESADESHGEVISALAHCLPSGRALHGTGMNKGFIVSQVASTGSVELLHLDRLEDDTEGEGNLESTDTTADDSAEESTSEEIATVEDAEALCLVVEQLVDAAEEMADEEGTSDKAKGRPDWAGPKGDDAEEDSDEGDDTEGGEMTTQDAEVDEDRGGPPAHAGKGRDKAKKGKGRG